MSSTFSDELLQSIMPIYRKIQRHPFVKEFTLGRLDNELFKFYLNQYLLFLKEYSRGLSILAAKAPSLTNTSTLTAHAKLMAMTEKELIKGFLANFKVKIKDAYKTQMIPIVSFYTSHLLQSAYRGTFAEGLAAFLPRYLSYYEVAKTLSIKSSTTKTYQKWINSYTHPKYVEMVGDMIAITNQTTKFLSVGEKNRLSSISFTTARLEYMFWDDIYKRQTWPV